MLPFREFQESASRSGTKKLSRYPGERSEREACSDTLNSHNRINLFDGIRSMECCHSRRLDDSRDAILECWVGRRTPYGLDRGAVSSGECVVPTGALRHHGSRERHLNRGITSLTMTDQRFERASRDGNISESSEALLILPHSSVESALGRLESRQYA